jgi:hypothetical protein
MGELPSVLKKPIQGSKITSVPDYEAFIPARQSDSFHSAAILKPEGE